jgi:hypothetical protein
VPTPDDEQFEAFLRQFRPLVPETLASRDRAPRSRDSFVLGAGISAAAAVLIAVGFTLHIRSHRTAVSNPASHAASAQQPVPSEPLTLRSANALLAAAPSFKAAVDHMAFHSQTIPLPHGQQSAIGVLSQEKIKL